MPRREVIKNSRKITLQLLQIIDWSKIAGVSMYGSLEKLHEVDTKLFRAALHTQFPSTKLSVVSANKDAPVPENTSEIIIVPVVGFDASLHRLGMGGGFYDRYLARQPKALKIGLAHSAGKIEGKIDWQPHDIAMHKIITETIIYSR